MTAGTEVETEATFGIRPGVLLVLPQCYPAHPQNETKPPHEVCAGSLCMRVLGAETRLERKNEKDRGLEFTCSVVAAPPNLDMDVWVEVKRNDVDAVHHGFRKSVENKYGVCIHFSFHITVLIA